MIANVYGCANPSPAVQEAMRRAWLSTIKPEHRRPSYAQRQQQASNWRKNERPLTERERALVPMLKLLADAGKTADEAAKVAGWSRSAVFRIARVSGFCFSAKKAAAWKRAEAARPAIEKGIAEGRSMTEVAKELGVYASTIRKFCNRLGIDYPSPYSRVAEVKDDVLRAVLNGMSQARAAREFGISEGTVSRIVKGRAA